MMNCPKTLAAMTLLAAVTAGSAGAQTSLLRVDGGAGGALGSGIEAVASLPDVTGDGVPDLVIGDPPAMQVRTVDGATGATIDTRTEVWATTMYGWAVAVKPEEGGDDGVWVIVGDPGASRVVVYLVAFDGMFNSILFDDESLSGNFGWSVAFTNDVDLDGTLDYFAGAPGSSVNGVNSGGAVWRSGGGQTRIIDDGEPGSGLGYSVDGLSDIDEDGQAELLASTITGPDVRIYTGGTVFCYDAQTMMPCPEPVDLATLGSISVTSLTGLAAKNCGDVDNDGFDDIVIGNVFKEEAELPGSWCQVYSGTTELTLLRDVQETNSGSFFFGSAVSAAGDVDADGFVDFIAGSFLNNFARVYSGEEGAPMFTWRGDGFKEGFGFSVGAAGDNDQDGFADVVIGTQQDYVKVQSGLHLVQTGDRLDGAIAVTTDDDQAAFHGLEGMVVKVRVKNLAGGVKPRVRIVDALGKTIADWDFQFQGKTQKKKVTLKDNMLHRVVVTGRKGTTGAYRVRTNAGFPKKAKKQKETESGKALGGLVETEFLAVPGSTLKARLKPLKGFPAFPSAQLLQPDGSALVLIPYTTAQKPKTTVLKGVPLSDLGVYKLIVYGAESTKSQLQMLVKPTQSTGSAIVPIE